MSFWQTVNKERSTFCEETTTWSQVLWNCLTWRWKKKQRRKHIYIYLYVKGDKNKGYPLEVLLSWNCLNTETGHCAEHLSLWGTEVRLRSPTDSITVVILHLEKNPRKFWRDWEKFANRRSHPKEVTVKNRNRNSYYFGERNLHLPVVKVPGQQQWWTSRRTRSGWSWWASSSRSSSPSESVRTTSPIPSERLSVLRYVHSFLFNLFWYFRAHLH